MENLDIGFSREFTVDHYLFKSVHTYAQNVRLLCLFELY